MRCVTKVIALDPHQNTFVRASEHYATPVTINFSHAVEVWNGALQQKRRWGEARLLSQLLDFLDVASKVNAHEQDVEEAYLGFNIPVEQYGFDLITDEVDIGFGGTHVVDHLEFEIEVRAVSPVGFQNETKTSWKGMISWDDLLRNVSDLIAALSQVGLKRLSTADYQRYRDLVSRGLLDREAAVPRLHRRSSVEHGWVLELLSMRASDLLADERLDLLALEPQVFERQPELRSVCAFGVHPHDAVRALATRYVGQGDLTDAYELLSGDVAWQEALRAIAHDDHLRLVQELARLPDVPQEVSHALATDPVWIVRKALAERQGVSTEVRLVLARDREHAVRTALSSCGDLQRAVAEVLVSDPDSSIRAAAVHFVGSDSILSALAGDDSVDVRRELAGRACLPPHVYEVLASDSSERVRYSVAANPSAPDHVIEALSLDPDEDVVVAAALHPLASRTALRRLATDPRERVRWAAAQRDRCLPEALEDASFPAGEGDEA